jgi:hypothetical protein
MSALQTCLDQCRRATAPLAELERFVQGLRRNPQWEDSEVRQIETEARRAISSPQEPR